MNTPSNFPCPPWCIVDTTGENDFEMIDAHGVAFMQFGMCYENAELEGNAMCLLQSAPRLYFALQSCLSALKYLDGKEANGKVMILLGYIQDAEHALATARGESTGQP